jgi:hypothetical protein
MLSDSTLDSSGTLCWWKYIWTRNNLNSAKSIYAFIEPSSIRKLTFCRKRGSIPFPYHIGLIAIPILVQTYLIFATSYFTTKKLRIPYTEAAPTAFIGASNFFELAVAIAIILFCVNSGVTLAVVVGVLLEVPLMLSLVEIMKRNRSKFEYDVTCNKTINE